MSYPTMFRTPGVRAFAEAIDDERAAQIAKFGDQRHPDGTGGDNAAEMAEGYRAHNELHEPSWQPILLEEVYEALAESDPAKLRAELLQVAAVCAAWIYDIDQRPAS